MMGYPSTALRLHERRATGNHSELQAKLRSYNYFSHKKTNG